MHLTEAQNERFYNLHDCLMIYANEVLGIGNILYDEETGHPFPNAVQEVAEAVWEDVSIINDLVSENPFGFSGEEIEAILKWKQAITGVFVVFDHEQDAPQFLGNGYVFEVRGLTMDIGELLPYSPIAVKGTLLPFEGSIVFGMQLLSFQVTFGEGMLRMFGTSFAEALEEHGLVKTEKDFLDISEQYRMEEGLQAIDGLLEELEKDAKGKQPQTETLTEGYHRGALAGLSSEERADKIFGEMFSEGFDEIYREELLRQSLNARPTDSLKDILGHSTKDRLLAMLRPTKMPGLSKLKKAELVDRAAEHLSTDADLFRSIAVYGPPVISKTFQKLVVAGGRIDIDPEGTEEDDKYLSSAYPFICLFRHEGIYSFVIPKELMGLAQGLDFDDIEQERSDLQAIDYYADALTDLCGIVSLNDCHALYREHYPEGFPLDEFLQALVNHYDLYGPDYAFWPYEDEIYLVRYDLVPEDGFYDAGLKDELDDYKKFLLERHAAIPRKAWTKEEFEYAKPYLRVMDLPSTIRFREFLDAHVPDGEDDFFFADGIIDEIYDMTVSGAQLTHIIEFMDDMDMIFDLEDGEKMISVLTNFVNNIPRWDNNGWSPNELVEQQTGKRLFLDEDGKPVSVGRNDPCPCGSGKKYKKCCGS